MKVLLFALSILIALPALGQKRSFIAVPPPSPAKSAPAPPGAANTNALVLRVTAAAAEQDYGTLNLQWDYPAAELTSEISFNVYEGQIASIPLNQWRLYTNLPTQSVRLPIVPGLHLFYVTATNAEVGLESGPSNWVSRPPLPPTGTTISK